MIKPCPVCDNYDIDLDVVYEGNSDNVIGRVIVCWECNTELKLMTNISRDKIIKLWNKLSK